MAELEPVEKRFERDWEHVKDDRFERAKAHQKDDRWAREYVDAATGESAASSLIEATLDA